MWIDERGSDVLRLPECRRLLALGAKQHLPGHLAVAEEGAPTVVPVDYAVYGPDVLIRVGDGLLAHIDGRLVAFEVEGAEDGQPWSVLLRGLAQGVEAGRFGAGPTPRVAEPGSQVVLIRSDVLTGRRLSAVVGDSGNLAS